MNLNTDHYARCISTLETSLMHLNAADRESIDFEIFRNAVVKGFELTLETAESSCERHSKPIPDGRARLTP